jgi:hypothetical protein
MKSGTGYVTVGKSTETMLGEYEHIDPNSGNRVVTIKNPVSGSNVSSKHVGMSCTYNATASGSDTQYTGTVMMDKQEGEVLCGGLTLDSRSVHGWGDDTNKHGRGPH